MKKKTVREIKNVITVIVLIALLVLFFIWSVKTAGSFIKECGFFSTLFGQVFVPFSVKLGMGGIFLVPFGLLGIFGTLFGNDKK